MDSTKAQLSLSACPSYLHQGKVVTLVRSRKVWELLGYLALTDHLAERTVIAQTLWPQKDLPQALQSLRQTLQYVRLNLHNSEAWLTVNRSYISINQEQVVVELKKDEFLEKFACGWSTELVVDPQAPDDIEDDFLFVPFKRLDRETRRTALLGMAPAMMNLGHFREGLEEIHELRQHPSFANDFSLAICEAELRSFGKQVQEARNILTVFRNHPESSKPKNFGRLRVLDSVCSFLEGDFAKSRSEALDVLKLSSDLGITRQVSRAMHIASGASYYLGDIESAQSILDRALKFSSNETSGSWNLIFHFLRAYMNLESDQLEGVHEELVRLKRLFWMDTQNGINGVFLGRVGHLFLRSGHEDEAKLLYTESLRRLKATDCCQETAEIHSYLGDLHSSRQNFDLAMKSHMAAVELRRPLSSPVGLATSLRGVGVAAAELGLHDRALIHFEEASKLFTEIRNPFGIASTRIGIARTYFKMGRQNEARQLFEAAIRDMEQAHKKTPRTARPVEFASIEMLQAELQAMRSSRKN